MESLFNWKKHTVSTEHANLVQLPDEIVLHILAFLPAPDILSSVCHVNHRMRRLGINVFLRKLRNPDQCRLRLYFDQETRWRAAVDLYLVEGERDAQTLRFAPIDNGVIMRMYTSMLLQRPILHKVALVGKDFEGATSTHMRGNLLQHKTFTIDLKSQGLHIKTGNIPCKRQFRLSYNVMATPAGVRKSRPGERWLAPLSFECLPFFFCQRKSGLVLLLKRIPVIPLLQNNSVRQPTGRPTLPLALIDTQDKLKKGVSIHSQSLPRERITLALL